MKAMTYSAKVLPDGHLSLPEEIKEKMGLTANSRVKVVLEREVQREKAVEAFGTWSERPDIKDGVAYVDRIRAGWNSSASCSSRSHASTAMWRAPNWRSQYRTWMRLTTRPVRAWRLF